MRALSMITMLSIYAFAAAAVAHTLDTNECKWFVRDVYTDAEDRDDGKTLATQVAEFQNSECGKLQNGCTRYKDAEDRQRLTDALTAMYGPDIGLNPLQVSNKAATKCVADIEAENKMMDALRQAHGVR